MASFFLFDWTLATRGDARSSPLHCCKIDSWRISCGIEGGQSRFNKIARCITCSADLVVECCYSPLVDRGGEEGRRCGGSSSRPDEQLLLVRFVLQEFWNHSCCMAEKMGQSVKLQRMEEAVCIVISATSAIKRFVNCKLSGGGVDLSGFLLARLGDEEKGVHPIRAWSLLGLHQGRSSASLGSFLTVAFMPSPFNMVGRRPLPPSASVTAFPGWRLKVFFNLLAVMPFRRPFSYGAVCSRPLAPSGVVPGDEEGDCPELWMNRTGEGAGSNCVPNFLLRVLCAKCSGLDVIFNFLDALSVNCSGADY